MANVFLTSDCHWNHWTTEERNVLVYCDRPFASIKEHDQALIENWNSVVKYPDDIVINLGDVAFGGSMAEDYVRDILRQLNGKIIMVWGNHDNLAKQCQDMFYEVHSGIYARWHQRNFLVCCHFPMLEWLNSEREHVYHFFGHVHSGSNKQFLCMPNSCDVGMDAWNYRPVLLEEAIERAKSPKGKLVIPKEENHSDDTERE